MVQTGTNKNRVGPFLLRAVIGRPAWHMPYCHMRHILFCWHVGILVPQLLCVQQSPWTADTMWSVCSYSTNWCSSSSCGLSWSWCWYWLFCGSLRQVGVGSRQNTQWMNLPKLSKHDHPVEETSYSDSSFLQQGEPALFVHANTHQVEGVASTFWQIHLRWGQSNGPHIPSQSTVEEDQ